MSEAGLPAPVRDFIVRYITSIEQMELLLLFASDPAKSWTIQQLVSEIRSSQESVNQRIKQLMEDGLVARDGEILRFAPMPPEKVAIIRELAASYREYRVRITELIYSRAGALKSFSDAFKLKPKK